MNTRAIVFFAFVAAIAAQCGAGLSNCVGQCYDPKTLSCVLDQANSKNVLCPLNNQACNGGCFLPSAYHCANGQLQGGAATGTPQTATPTSSSAATPTTSSTSAAATTSSSVAVPKTTSSSSTTATPTTSSTAAPTTSSSTTSTAAPTTSSSTTSAAATTAATCNTAGCGVGTCNCNGACFTPGQYNCAVDVYTGKNQLCQSNYASCNGNCFDTTKGSCSSSGNIVANGAAGGNTPASSTYPPPVVNPAPAPSNRPKQTADLRIINSCKSTLWFEGRYGGQGAPIPGQSVTAIQAPPGGYVDYTVPDSGLSGSRFWAKYGCDAYGKNCLIGDAMQYWPNPPGGCPAGGCTPPVDSLFEATWGCRPGTSCNSQNPTTWFDTSQVDGWTIPYKLTPNGDTSGCDCTASGCGFSGVDASRLDLAKCPSTENLSDNGQFPSVNVLGTTVSLNSVDLRIIKNNSVIGCMSPCKRLNWGAPYGLQQSESSGSTMWMCCPTPTPDDCQPSNGCVSSPACRAGPIVNTQFVSAVHTMAPGVYSYSYDDGVGLHACPAGVVTYTMEFCPSGSTQYPLPL